MFFIFISKHFNSFLVFNLCISQKVRLNFLLVARYFLLVARCSLLFARCSLLFARCSLLSARCSLIFCSLLITFCSLLFARCSLLFARLLVSYFQAFTVNDSERINDRVCFQLQTEVDLIVIYRRFGSLIQITLVGQLPHETYNAHTII